MSGWKRSPRRRHPPLRPEGERRRRREDALDGVVGGAAAADGRGGHALAQAAVGVVRAVAALGALAEALPPVRRRPVQHPEEVVHPVLLLHGRLRTRWRSGGPDQQQRAEDGSGDQLQRGGRTRSHAVKEANGAW